MSEKDFIKDGLQNEEIVNIIKQIRPEIEKDASDDNIEKLRKKFNFFADRYPVLFDLSTREDHFSWENLNYFLNMRTKIIEDNLTADKASVIVGQDMYNKYVNITEPPPPSKFERKQKKSKT